MAIPHSLSNEHLVLPSVLSADFSRLGEATLQVIQAGARVLHIDVMDGHFVPNITIGQPVVASLAPVVHAAGAFLDVHLMIEEPERYLEDFARAGADGLSVHIEACRHIHKALSTIRELGLSAGVVLNPGTPLGAIEEAACHADFVLLMSVNPGFGGQSFIPQSVDKIRRLRAMLPPQVPIQVDGGVGRDTIRVVAAAGGRWLVAGSAVFGAADPAAEFRLLSAMARGTEGGRGAMDGSGR